MHLLEGIQKCLSELEGVKDKKVAVAKFQDWCKARLRYANNIYYMFLKIDFVGNTISIGTV